MGLNVWYNNNVNINNIKTHKKQQDLNKQTNNNEKNNNKKNTHTHTHKRTKRHVQPVQNKKETCHESTWIRQHHRNVDLHTVSNQNKKMVEYFINMVIVIIIIIT